MKMKQDIPSIEARVAKLEQQIQDILIQLERIQVDLSDVECQRAIRNVQTLLKD